jgi:hypothetical protein
MMSNISANLCAFKPDPPIQKIAFACKKYIFWMKYLLVILIILKLKSEICRFLRKSFLVELFLQ